jgi:flavin reductase (DIM6/NTAB) family NADH-FMN oxidoreductase RutF
MTAVRNGTPVPPEQDTALLRQTFGAFCTGVTIVTVGGDQPRGMTANSFTAVSLDPALVLICVARDALMHEAMLRTESFGISVLGAEQEEVARHFASKRPPGAEQFAAIGCTDGELTGAPLVDGAAAHLECELWRTYDGGDHSIFVGRLLSMAGTSDDEVLVFLRGHFGSAA